MGTIAEIVDDVRRSQDISYDQIVELIDKQEFVSDPVDAYVNRIYSKGAPLKSAVIWNPEYIA